MVDRESILLTLMRIFCIFVFVVFVFVVIVWATISYEVKVEEFCKEHGLEHILFSENCYKEVNGDRLKFYPIMFYEGKVYFKEAGA